MVEIKNLNFDFSDGILREHNQDTYKKVVYSLMKGKKTLFEQATGTGKSYIACKLLHDFGGEQRALFVCPSKPIQDQFKGFFKDWVVGKGTTNCSLDTCLYQGLNAVKSNEYDIIIFDEVHRMGAKTWGPNSKELMDNNPNAKIIGMTATLQRPDCVDIRQYFDGNNPVSTLTLAQTLERGNLPCPDYTLAKIDFGEDEKFLSDNIRDFKAKLKEAKTTEEKDEIKEYLDKLNQARRSISESDDIQTIFAREMPDKMKTGKFIVFCPAGKEEIEGEESREDITRMKNIIKQSKTWFTDTAGVGKVKRYTCYSGMDNKINDQVIKTFEEDDSKSLKLLFCVNMLNEGLHVKGIDGVIMLRPTSSNIIYLQQLGRALAVGGNNPKIFDFVANLSSVDVEQVQNLVKAVNGEKAKLQRERTEKQTDDKSSEEKYFDSRFNLTTENLDKIRLIDELKESIFDYNNNNYLRTLEYLYNTYVSNGRLPSYSQDVSKEEQRDAVILGSLFQIAKSAGGIDEYCKKYPEREEYVRAIVELKESMEDPVLTTLKHLNETYISNGRFPSQSKKVSEEERHDSSYLRSIYRGVEQAGGIDEYCKRYPDREKYIREIFDLKGRVKDSVLTTLIHLNESYISNGILPSVSKQSSKEEQADAKYLFNFCLDVKNAGGIDEYCKRYPDREKYIREIFDLKGRMEDSVLTTLKHLNETYISNGILPSRSKQSSEEEQHDARYLFKFYFTVKQTGGIDKYCEKFPDREECARAIVELKESLDKGKTTQDQKKEEFELKTEEQMPDTNSENSSDNFQENKIGRYFSERQKGEETQKESNEEMQTKGEVDEKAEGSIDKTANNGNKDDEIFKSIPKDTDDGRPQ